MRQTEYVIIVLLAAVVMAVGCDRGHNAEVAALLEQGHELVKKLESREAHHLLERIDSFRDERHVADTLAADVCADVALQLRMAKRYKELNAWVNDANEHLERIATHERPMQERIMRMNLIATEAYFDLKLYDRFMQMLIKLEVTAKRYQLNDQLQQIHIDMAAVCNEKGQYDKALTILQGVVEHKDDLGNIEDLVIAYNNIAWAWRGKGNFDKAVENAMLALHNVPAGNTLMEMRTRSNIGTYYNRMHEYSLAQKQLEMAVDYYDKHNVVDELCGTLPKLATSLWKQGQIAAAKATFERVMSIRDMGPLMAKTAILNNYAAFCDSMGDYRLEINLLQQLQGVNDSILLGSSNDALTQLYSDELARGDKNLTDYQRSRKQLWWSVSLLLLAMAGIVWGMQRRYERLERQKREVESVSDERQEHLLVAAVDEMKFTATAQSLAKQLQDLQKTVAQEPAKTALQELRKITSQVMRLESERNNELTTLANADFFKRLLERWPDLTNNDLRICALLRRGMTSKEIAAVMCRESQTIDITRTRIRRKCGLQPDEDLNTFMMMV